MIPKSASRARGLTKRVEDAPYGVERAANRFV